MSFLHMSVAGAAMILAITVIRALTINRVPKKTFLALWGAVLLRLLIPFSLPSRLSVYALLARKTAAVMPDVPAAALKADPAMQTLSVSPQPGKVNGAAISVWGVVWAVGLLACAAAFAVAYWKCYREFQTSLPVDNAACRRWLQAHPLRRAMTIRQSDRISSPLTFGMLRPVILMPKKTDWQDERTLQYVLEHEFVHIRRFDMLSKLLLIAAACVHWFNPLVWVMYVLANRDLELSCDESVVRHFGGGKRAAYANVLISMEETKSGFAPLCNHFSKNAIEERITAIMKIKKTTVLSFAAAAALVAGTVTAFATSAPIPNPNPNERAGAVAEENSGAARGGAEAFAAGEGLKPRAEYVAVGITEKEKLWYYQGKPIAAIYDDNSGIYGQMHKLAVVRLEGDLAVFILAKVRHLDKINAFQRVYAAGIGLGAVALHKLHALFGGLVLFPLVGGNMLAGFQADGGHFRRAQAQSSAGGIHGHRAAADDDALLALHHEILVRHAVGVLIVVYKVHKLDGSVNAVIVPLGHPGDFLAVGRARRHNDGVIFLLQIFNLLFAQARAALDIQAGFFQPGDILSHGAAIQTERGNGAHKHAAGLGVALKHGYVIAQGRKEMTGGQTRRACADDGDALIVHARIGGTLMCRS